MEDLYKHIESLGKEHGYKNMTVLCKAAGVPRSTMSELNNGRSKDLSKPNAQKFADILGVTLDEVYGEETKKAPTQDGERGIDEQNLKVAFFPWSRPHPDQRGHGRHVGGRQGLPGFYRSEEEKGEGEEWRLICWNSMMRLRKPA